MSESDKVSSSNPNIEITSASTTDPLPETPKQDGKFNDNVARIEVTPTFPPTDDSSFTSKNEEEERMLTTPLPTTSENIQLTKEDHPKNDTRTIEEIKEELSEFTSFKEKDPRKRKRYEDEENLNILSGIFLRSMYPLNDAAEKTITVGIFKCLNFKPAVLLNQCGKASLIFTAEMWDRFTKYETIIEAYLYNNLTGRKTAMGFDNSDTEIDSIRIRGTQFVRLRDLSKHNKKILLTFEEFQVLSNLTPAIIRYIQQLTTYYPLIFDYLNSSINTNPVVPLIYGPIDHAIYNRLPQEVAFHRKTELFFRRMQCDKMSAENDLQENITFENTKTANEGVKTEDTTA